MRTHTWMSVCLFASFVWVDELKEGIDRVEACSCWLLSELAVWEGSEQLQFLQRNYFELKFYQISQ